MAYLTKETRKTLSLIGANFCLGQRKQGVELASNLLRKKNLVETLSKKYKVQDKGDVTFKNQSTLQKKNDLIEKARSVGLFNKNLAEKIEKIHSRDALTLTLGGDHSIALGSISGILQHSPNLGVIWVDAHADINTPKTSPSLNYHGMPVSFLLRISKLESGFEWLKSLPKLKEKNIVYIGLRDVDPGEKEILEKLGILAFYFNGKTRPDAAECAKIALSKLSKCEDLHLSFDIDSLDPEIAPATGTPVKNGLTLDEAKEICTRIRSSGKLKSMDLVEINKELGKNEKEIETTLQSGLEVLDHAL